MSGSLDAVGWGDVIGWCRRELGSAPTRRLLTAGYVSTVLALVLQDGREVVVKLRAAEHRIHAVLEIQRRLFEEGFPCPEPLTGASPLGPFLVSAEVYVPAEQLLSPPPPTECAERLATAVDLAGPPGEVETLAPPPPWVAWDHSEPGTWPRPDDLATDLNEPAGPTWLCEPAERVRARLHADLRAPVIGHCDWEAHNLGWRDGHIVVVYDWDSVAVRTEPAVAGAAATVFASDDRGPIAATLQQTEDFLGAYRELRPWWDDEATEVAYAAGLWGLLYNARKELAGGGAGYLAHLERELAPRLRRAGA